MFRVIIDGQQVAKTEYAGAAISELDFIARSDGFGTAVIVHDDEAGPVWDRLRYLAGVMCEPYYNTPSGIQKVKTNKQRTEERAVFEAVVRFAFDHMGIRGDEGNLAPGGLQMQLIKECGGYRFPKSE